MIIQSNPLPDHLCYEPYPAPATLIKWLTESNSLTRSHLNHLKPHQANVPQLEIINPPYWEFGHISWFHEFWVHRKGLFSKPSILNNADSLFNSSTVNHSDRWTIAIPAIDQLLKFNEEVLQESLFLLNQSPTSQDLYFIQLAIFHQDMHNEAFAYTCQTLGDTPPFTPFTTINSKKSSKNQYIYFSDSKIDVGSKKHSGFIFDNEKWMHSIIQPAFSISSKAVSNGEYLEFLESKNNQTPLYQIEIPIYWKNEGNIWLQRYFDQWTELNLDDPVRHISLNNAKEYCQWRGVRLPSEHELTILMEQDSQLWEPSNLWEWADSPFLPYPGFTADPYSDYSQPWFDGNYYVLKGWSEFTPERLRRKAFRNFYMPHRRDHFCGFRTCLL